jgi:N-acetylglucosaminyl-diphospho-decaprenol L-rhamnosyltransferase
MDLAAAGWQLAYVPELVVHHLPTPSGRDPRARHRVEARNRVLTAVLRRPASVVRAVVAEAWRDPAGRAGVLDAARQLGWVLRQRRRLPAGVEAALGTLSRVDRVPVSRTAPSLAG